MQCLGIDIGGSGIKAAIVDTATGELVAPRQRIATPELATPDAVMAALNELLRQFDWQGPIGCGFPAVIVDGVAKSAANIDPSWIGVNVSALLATTTGCPCTVINDADAAGLAEMRFGCGQGRRGTVIMLTIGTGIGSAFFTDGTLFPNTELGHLRLKAGIAERYASAAVRKKQLLGWKPWGKRLNKFLAEVERLFSPELVIVGGGVSSRHEKFFPFLEVGGEILPARLGNQAGIIGAACLAAGQR